jgi:hypothetical protein
MLKLVRENLKLILVATIAATIAAGAPAIAHGVRHALFAHNAGKVDGIEGRALQKRCKDGSVLAFARIEPGNVDPAGLSSDGITDAYNCASPNNPAQANKGPTGSTFVRFPGLMSGYQPDQAEYVVTGNIEGGARLLTFQRSELSTPSGVQAVIEAQGWNTVTDAPEDTNFTITLIKVLR